MIKKLLLILIFTILYIQVACPQDLSAEKIIANVYMSSALGKIQDMIIDLDFFGPTTNKTDAKNTIEQIGYARVFFSSPNKIRAEKTIIMQEAGSDMYIITIRDGRLSYQYTPLSPFPATKTGDNNYHSYLLPFNVDTQPQDQYRKYTLIGKESIEDRSTYIIGISNEKDPEAKLTTVWIDAERFVPLKEEYTVAGKDGAEIKKKNVYKDIQQLADGRWIPFKLEKYENNKMTIYLVYKQVIINQGLPSSLFNMEGK